MTPKRPGSRTILRASFATLRAHPRLLWFPVLSALGTGLCIVVGVAVAQLAGAVAADPSVDLGFWSILADPDPDADETFRRGVIAGSALGALTLQLVSLVSAVALSAATMEAMAGRDWSVRGALGSALRRLTAIATVAVIHLGVGRLLHGSRKGNKKKRGFFASLTAKFFELAWWAATYLLVPVLAREGKGGIASILRSASLFRRTWKEAFIGRLSLGWAWGLIVAGAVIPAGVCAWLGAQSPTVWILAVGVPGLVVVACAVVIRTLDTIYRTALYVFASEGVVPGPFDDPELDAVFCVSG